MTITSRIGTLKKLIQNAETSSHRPPGSVLLLAVSKQHSPEAVTEAFHAGCRDFGENYLQEALLKMEELSDLPIDWHFIGAAQRNKTKTIASHFSWVHTVATRLVAQRLNDARPEGLPALNVCIQLNLDDEESKGGVCIEEAAFLAAYITTLPRLALRGLMVIPKVELDSEKQYVSFLRVAHCLQDINRRLNLSMDTLSMGMSDDFEAAIRAGSTMIRVGSAIFGRRAQVGTDR